MSFGGSLLKGSKFHAQFISFVQQSDQLSEIQSSNQHLLIPQKKVIPQSKNVLKPSVLKYRNNLLSIPCADYHEKSQIFLQKQVEEKIQKNFEKQLYYGKRKHKVIQISDVSSYQEQGCQKWKKNAQKNRRNSKQEDPDLDRYQLIQKSIDCQQKRMSRRQWGQNNQRGHEHRNQQRSRQKPCPSTNRRGYRNNLQQQIQKQAYKTRQQQGDSRPRHAHPTLNHHDPPGQSLPNRSYQLSDLNPAQSANQNSHQNQSQQRSRQISSMGSDKSIFVIRRKGKSTHKRLRKMVNMTNRVKIQNKQNQGETQECPICLIDLNQKAEKKKGRLPCNHVFCLKCILEASRFSNRCPYCRAGFNQIVSNGRRIRVQDTRLNQEFQDPNDEPCYVCGRNDDFQRLLECEFCQYSYCHTYCDPRLSRNQPPQEVWYCASCEELLRNRHQNAQFEDADDQEIALLEEADYQDNAQLEEADDQSNLQLEEVDDQNNAEQHAGQNHLHQLQDGQVVVQASFIRQVKIQQRIVSEASSRIIDIQSGNDAQQQSQIRYPSQNRYQSSIRSQAQIDNSERISEKSSQKNHQSKRIKLQIEQNHQKSVQFNCVELAQQNPQKDINNSSISEIDQEYDNINI